MSAPPPANGALCLSTPKHNGKSGTACDGPHMITPSEPQLISNSYKLPFGFTSKYNGILQTQGNHPGSVLRILPP